MLAKIDLAPALSKAAPFRHYCADLLAVGRGCVVNHWTTATAFTTRTDPSVAAGR